MSKKHKNAAILEKKPSKKSKHLVKDPDTGLVFLTGPSITKEKVQKDFPADTDRDTIIIRRSVGL